MGEHLGGGVTPPHRLGANLAATPATRCRRVAPVATVFTTVPAILATITAVFAAIPAVFQAIPAPANVACVAAVFAPVADVLAAITPVFAAVAHILAVIAVAPPMLALLRGHQVVDLLVRALVDLEDFRGALFASQGRILLDGFDLVAPGLVDALDLRLLVVGKPQRVHLLVADGGFRVGGLAGILRPGGGRG